MKKLFRFVRSQKVYKPITKVDVINEYKESKFECYVYLVKMEFHV